MINKELVKFRFKNSIETYNSSAVIQKEMAQKLVDLTLQNCGNKYGKIFEFGAGTGFLSKLILNEISFDEYYANDIIEESEYCIKNIIKDVKFLAGDIEKLELNQKFDLVLSNAVVQWIENIDELFEKIKSNLNNDGFFAFTTFGEQNFREIKETTGVSLNYLKSETLKNKCGKDFEILVFDENIQTLCFDSPIEVLKHIKKSGTNAIKSQKWTVSKLKDFEKFYKKSFGVGEKVMLTYNPIFVILKVK